MLCLNILQVAAKNLVNYYRSTKRRRVTCWFAQTVRRHLCTTAARRNTAPESVGRSRRTSTAGESHFLFFCSSEVARCLRGQCSPRVLPLLSVSLIVFTYFCCLSFGHLSTSHVFRQSFQLSKAQQEMPLASL